MLQEIEKPRQNPGEYLRRVFCDDFFDLYVWYESRDLISGFQLCYGEPIERRALTWTMAGGFRHNAIDPGESAPGRFKSIPILVPDGRFEKSDILKRFRAASGTLEAAIRETVLEKLANYR